MERGRKILYLSQEAAVVLNSAGTISTIKGGDGVMRQIFEIPGSYPSSGGTWYNGVFQFIKEPNGVINHRLFVPNP